VKLETHATPRAPAALGPYSQAVSHGGWLFTAGQVGIDPRTGELVDGDFESEARQVLANLSAVLDAAGTDLSRVVKSTIYLTDMENFAVLNEVYAEVFAGHCPSRSTVEVRRLPKNARLEIDLVAAL